MSYFVHVPKTNWKTVFLKNLANSKLSFAKTLHHYLKMPKKYNTYYFDSLLAKYKARLEKQLKHSTGQQAIFKTLVKTRKAVLKSDISKNPKGQILEPGFRVIFPNSH